MLNTEVIEKVSRELAIRETVTENPAEVDQLERAASYRLSDAMREGAEFTSKAVGWGSGESACALSAAYIAAKARKYV